MGTLIEKNSEDHTRGNNSYKGRMNFDKSILALFNYNGDMIFKKKESILPESIFILHIPPTYKKDIFVIDFTYMQNDKLDL